MKEKDVIIGIDASTTATGYAVFKGRDLIAYGCVRPDGKEWRERVLNLGSSLTEIMSKYAPKKIIVEDVPLSTGGGVRTGIILGFLQGYIFGIAHAFNVEIGFVSPSEWRSKVGVFSGDRKGTKREALKQASVEKANEIYGLRLRWVSPSSKKNDDDISDAILIAHSSFIERKRKFQKRKGVTNGK